MTVHYSQELEERAIERDKAELLLAADGILTKFPGLDIRELLEQYFPEEDVFYFAWYAKPEKYVLYFKGDEKEVRARFAVIPYRDQDDQTGL